MPRLDYLISLPALWLISISNLVQHAAGNDPIKECPIPTNDGIDGQEDTFYICIEAILQCGQEGYPLSYGAKYARRFYNVARPQMNQMGKDWVDGTLICLQDELQSSISANTDCATVRETAISSHNGCYVENGFCDLGFQNWTIVIGVISFFDLVKGIFGGVSLLFRCLTGVWLFK
jgi:hypothetical protein